MILVVGATGMLGGLITQRLLANGKEVRILVRENSPAEAMALQNMATSPKKLIDGGAKPFYADLKDSDSLNWACDGIDTVITSANSAMRSGDDNVETVDRQGNLNLIEAAKVAGVNQFIFTSFLGADLNNPVPLFRAKAETEKALADSGLAYTILAPNFYFESWIGMVVGIPLQAHQPITLVGDGKRAHSLISLGDVAAYAEAAVGHPEAVNQRLALGGPEPLTWRGIVAEFEKVLGQQLPTQFVQPGAPIPLLPEFVPPVLAAMESYDSVIPMEGLEAIFGITGTPLSAFIHRMLGIPG